MTKRRFVAGITALLVAVGVVSGVAAAAPPPAYFVDESKLPFDALAGTTTARYWGVHGGAGYRIEVPATGTASSCCTRTASGGRGSSSPSPTAPSPVAGDARLRVGGVEL